MNDCNKVIGQIRSTEAPMTIASGRQRSRITWAAYRSTVHTASVRFRSHKHKDVSCATDHSCHDICQARAFFRRKTQAQLRAPPEHIVRGLRPFLLDEVSHLRGREIRANAGSELLQAASRAEYAFDPRAICAHQAHHVRLVQERPRFPRHCRERLDAVIREIAARQMRPFGPGWSGLDDVPKTVDLLFG